MTRFGILLFFLHVIKLFLGFVHQLLCKKEGVGIIKEIREMTQMKIQYLQILNYLMKV